MDYAALAEVRAAFLAASFAAFSRALVLALIKYDADPLKSNEFSHCGFMTTSSAGRPSTICARVFEFIGAQMKKLMFAAAVAALAATPAAAADMLVKKAPPPPRAPAWSWTGFYLGANIGGGWAKTDWFEDVSGSGGGGPPGFQDASVSSSGVLGGGQIGFDWQNGWAVFGLQVDADAAGIRGNTSCFPQVASLPGVISSQQSCSTKIDALGTVTGRFGAAFDHTLYYVLAGFAWEHERLGNPASAQIVGGPEVIDAEFSGTKFGATAGAGIERALTANWSAFVQYNYMGFGRRAQQFNNIVFIPPGVTAPPFTEIIREDIHVIKVGVNYRFNWGPGR